MNDAAERAIAAEKPDRDTVELYVYSPDVDPSSRTSRATPRREGKPDTMVAAINRTLKDEMARNPRIVVFGEDVADCSREAALGVRVRQGRASSRSRTACSAPSAAPASSTRRSPKRTSSAAAIGMATRGIKPVVEIQFFDYIWPAMMQMRDEMSMLRYRSNNAFSCPMVIRVAIGGYLRGGAPYHSQSGESIFAHCPGIRIVFPSNAQDAAGLLRTAIRCDDPVLFLEHKHLYRQTYNKGEYPGPDYMIPFGKAAVRREGVDVVVITWGALVQRSLLAAQQAEKDGISVMVLDLRTIMPYDWETIAAGGRPDQPRRHRARGSADVRLRRRARRAHGRRAVRTPRRAGAARRRARHAGRLLSGPRGRDPAAVGGRAEGDPGKSPATDGSPHRSTPCTLSRRHRALDALLALLLAALAASPGPCRGDVGTRSPNRDAVAGRGASRAHRRQLPAADQLPAGGQRRLLHLRPALALGLRRSRRVSTARAS